MIKGIEPELAGAVQRCALANEGRRSRAVLLPPKPCGAAERHRRQGADEKARREGWQHAVVVITPSAPRASRRTTEAGSPTLGRRVLSGMNEFDQKLIYLGLDTAQDFVGTDSGVSGIEVKVYDIDRITDGVTASSSRCSAIGRSAPPTTSSLNAGIFSALKMQKAMMVVVLIFIMIVAAFNIASTLFMLVVRRRARSPSSRRSAPKTA